MWNIQRENILKRPIVRVDVCMVALNNGQID